MPIPSTRCCLFIVMALTGCTDKTGDSGSSDPCEAASNPELEIGHGELEFMQASDNEGKAELIHGPQGGYHINIAMQARFLDGSTPWFLDIRGLIDGEEVGRTLPIATPRCNRQVDALQAWGLLLIWDALPIELHGKNTTVVVDLADSAGTEMSGTAELTIWDPELE